MKIILNRGPMDGEAHELENACAPAELLAAHIYT